MVTPVAQSTGSTATFPVALVRPPMPPKNAAGKFSAGWSWQTSGSHAAYIASWLKVLKDDPKAIFTAASKAQQAADWMHAQQPHAEEVAA